MPIFSFEKLANVDSHLGPEMKSTGEVLGLAGTLEEALYKGLIAAGYKLRKAVSSSKKGVFLSVRDSDKQEIAAVAKKFYDLGFKLYATAGTARIISASGMEAEIVSKIHESDVNTLTLIESGKIDYLISTSAKGRLPGRDSVKIRRKAVERSIPCLTSIDTAHAVADSIKSRYSEMNFELVDINHMRTKRTQLKFTKMHGCGNDYIYFNAFEQRIDNPEGLSIRLADRHFGVGGDGVVLICPSSKADAKMRMFNLDGSEGKMCGNASRCVAKYLFDNRMVNKEVMTLETLSGIKSIRVYAQNGVATSAQVNMGAAELRPENIPVKLEGDKIIGRRVNIGGEDYDITCVSMGNPHCVVFVDSVDFFPLEKIGPQFEHDELFPERVNAEFIQVIDRSTLKMRVWERGSGETWACGTGACAAAVAAVENGLCDKNADITVKLLGGELKIRYTDTGEVYMTGNAVKVFDGTVII